MTIEYLNMDFLQFWISKTQFSIISETLHKTKQSISLAENASKFILISKIFLLERQAPRYEFFRPWTIAATHHQHRCKQEETTKSCSLSHHFAEDATKVILINKRSPLELPGPRYEFFRSWTNKSAKQFSADPSSFFVPGQINQKKICSTGPILNIENWKESAQRGNRYRSLLSTSRPSIVFTNVSSNKDFVYFSNWSGA